VYKINNTLKMVIFLSRNHYFIIKNIFLSRFIYMYNFKSLSTHNTPQSISTPTLGISTLNVMSNYKISIKDFLLSYFIHFNGINAYY